MLKRGHRMSNLKNDKIKKERFAKVWSSSRADAGKTQEFMANGLHVSKKTIQNWEKGVTAPDFFEGSEWFSVLGLNPMPYYLKYLFPDKFDEYSEMEDDENETDIDQLLLLLVKNMSETQKKELLYIIAGDHGSSWYSLLQMITAHCHTSLKSRVIAASTILENYKMEDALGETVCSRDIEPDVEMLEKAVKKARESVSKGLTGYTNV